MSVIEIAAPRIVPPLRLHESVAQMMTACPAGRARLAGRTGTRDLWFEGGRIVSVTSTRDDERLGAWLSGRRLVPAQAVDEALAARSPTERLGAALVRRGALAPEALRRELEALSLALLARMTLDGGEIAGDSAARLAQDARTVDAAPRALFIAAMRHSDEIGMVAENLGQDAGWTAVDGEPDAGAVDDLSENERYVLSILKRPRTLDGLRRAALIDFADVLRAVTVLAAAGLVTPCECRPALPPARTLAQALDLPTPTTAGAAPAAPAPPAPPAAAGEIGHRSVRAALEALDEAEANAAPMHDIEGRTASASQRRRVVAMLETAGEMLAAGEDRRAVKQLLNRALTVFPALAAILKVTELELAEPSTRPLALDRLQRILAKNPRCTDGWLLLAGYWESRGSVEKVHGCAARVLAYEPDHPDARRLASTEPVA